jgi:SAM-dependent methyltransferase
MLQLRPGERVLELACGNGDFSRRMAELGASVVASDFSPKMVEAARARGGEVDYRIADATDVDQLLSLGRAGEFDAIVSNMAMMDMSEIEPMAEGAATLVKPGGRFVFSTVHPAFNGNETVRMVEQSEDERGVIRRYSVKVSRYIRPSTAKGVALEGQPVTQWYFHRPMKDLIAPFLDHGFVLDGLDEPVLSPDQVRQDSTSAVFVEVPPVLVARMRPSARVVQLD